MNCSNLLKCLQRTNRLSRAARRRVNLVVIALGASSAFPSIGYSQSPAGPGLTGGSLTYNNAVEVAAAQANDLVYQTLDRDCNPGGVLDTLANPTFGDITARGQTPGPLCNQDTFFVYGNARELVHTANELQGANGPTIASLGVDLEGLGTALRWTAAEELAAQSSMATEFTNSQLSSLAARISALRNRATGFGGVGRLELLRRSSPMVAQADDNSEPSQGAGGEEYSPWGGFLNYGFGHGNKLSTPLEDAFDFDGSELTIGLDYRFDNNVVVGGILGLTRQDIDFDESASAISVVDGVMESEGESLLLFAMSQGERVTLSGSIGLQSLDYLVSRDIKYPSFNPDTESIYQNALSEPTSESLFATFGFGYAFTWDKVGLEPFLNIEYIDSTIDAFSEQRSLNQLGDPTATRRFDLAVSEQKIESLKTSVGFRFQYVFTPRWGVFVPFLSAAAIREHEDTSRTITAGYAALKDVLGTSTFVVPTDAPDESYVTASAGFSLILRGGRERELGGPNRWWPAGVLPVFDN